MAQVQSKGLRLLEAFLCTLLLVFSTFAWAQETNNLVPVPKFDYVTDEAGVLSSTQRQALWDKLSNFDKETGSQVCVVIVPSTNGESIESFAHRVGDEWRPGRKGIGDGLILFVAVKDHRARIDVMRDLEGAVPDLAANQILQEDLFPSFKKDDYYTGIDKGLDDIFKLIKGENLPPPSQTAEEDEDYNPLLDEPWLAIGLIGFGISMMLRQLLGPNSAPLSYVVCSVLGWFAMGSLIAAIVVAFVAVAISALIPDRILAAGAQRTARMNSRVSRRWRDGGWGGGFGGGFGGWGGFGGGGDGGGVGGGGGGASSGGGGGAGGGGASGGW